MKWCHNPQGGAWPAGGHYVSSEKMHSWLGREPDTCDDCINKYGWLKKAGIKLIDGIWKFEFLND